MTTDPTTEPLQEVKLCGWCRSPADATIGPDGLEARCSNVRCPIHNVWIPIAEWNTRTTPESEVWQPIETAPTNSSVLVYIPNSEHYGEGVYRAILVDMGTGRRWMTTALHMGRDCQWNYAPTHWMPLPNTPAAMRSTEGRERL